MRKYSSAFILMLLFTSLSAKPAQAGDIIFICNPSVSDSSLSKKDVKEIFLGKQRRWSDNKEITLVLLKDFKAYNAFVKKYINRTSDQFKTWWRTRIFSGQAGILQSFNSEKKLMEFIAETKGAIGFVNAQSPIPNSLKVIQITD